jgi:hypothetical protein
MELIADPFSLGFDRLSSKPAFAVQAAGLYRHIEPKNSAENRRKKRAAAPVKALLLWASGEGITGAA